MSTWRELSSYAAEDLRLSHSSYHPTAVAFKLAHHLICSSFLPAQYRPSMNC